MFLIRSVQKKTGWWPFLGEVGGKLNVRIFPDLLNSVTDRNIFYFGNPLNDRHLWITEVAQPREINDICHGKTMYSNARVFNNWLAADVHSGPELMGPLYKNMDAKSFITQGRDGHPGWLG